MTTSPNTQQAAFTLIELMVVIAIIAILAGLLLPVIASTKKRAHQATCLNNMDQIGLALNLYQGDFNDQFPAPGSASKYGPQPEDWIWWQSGRDVTNSSIARYVSGFNAKLFTCPADLEARDLQADLNEQTNNGGGFFSTQRYPYSYALTSYDLEGNRNLGMATIITQDRKVYPFRIDQVINPSAKLMLVEEARETIDDSRWVPHGTKPNLVTDRHRFGGNVVFADFHAEKKTPEFGQNPTNSQPQF